MPKSTAKEAAATRARVGELLLKGYTQAQIGEMLGLSQPAVYGHKKKLEETWEASYLPAIQKIKVQKLAELSLVRSKLWEALDAFDGDVDALKKTTDNILKAIAQESAMLGLSEVKQDTDIDPELYMKAYQTIEEYKKMQKSKPKD